MDKKFTPFVLVGIVVLIIVGGFLVFKGKLTKLPGFPSPVNKMFCRTDADCACGVDKKTGECAFGNKAYIDTSRQCPDFCTGIAGNLRIKCVNNLCTSVPMPIR